MNNKTLKITYGAMLVAVFALMLLLNRNTGGLLQGVLLFILPIPITAYAVTYGGKASLTVFACMVAMTFFFGTFSAVFYAISAALIGLVQGTRMYHKKDMTRTLFLVMIMAMAAELFDMVVLSQLTTGQGLDAMVAELQQTMNEALEQSASTMESVGGSESAQSADQMVSQMSSLMTTDYLKRIFLVTIAVTGALEGFIAFELSVIVLKKLRMPVPKQKPIAAFFPPKWTGILAVVGFFVYIYTFSSPLENEVLQGILQTFGIIGYTYLMIFGVIAVAAVLRTYVTNSKVLTIILTILAMFLLTYLTLMLGAWYLIGNLHQNLLDHSRQMKKK